MDPLTLHQLGATARGESNSTLLSAFKRAVLGGEFELPASVRTPTIVHRARHNQGQPGRLRAGLPSLEQHQLEFWANSD